MKKFNFYTAERIMWIGSIIMFAAAVLVGAFWGFLAQLPILIVMMFWGVVIRRYFTEG